jgi:hypothetical protein
MHQGITLGHGMGGEYEIADMIIPKSIENQIVIISTMWDEYSKKGQTIRITVPKRSYWDLYDNPSEVLATHASDEEGRKFHEDIVKKIGEAGGYCGSDIATREHAETDK